MTRVGLISDTHGLLRPEALAALAGSHFIVHAGDIGAPAVLDQLSALAPVTAVRGNINPGSAGPRRFRLPISLGRLRIARNDVQYELVTL